MIDGWHASKEPARPDRPIFDEDKMCVSCNEGFGILREIDRQSTTGEAYPFGQCLACHETCKTCRPHSAEHCVTCHGNDQIKQPAIEDDFKKQMVGMCASDTTPMNETAESNNDLVTCDLVGDIISFDIDPSIESRIFELSIRDYLTEEQETELENLNIEKNNILDNGVHKKADCSPRYSGEYTYVNTAEEPSGTPSELLLELSELLLEIDYILICLM